MILETLRYINAFHLGFPTGHMNCSDSAYTARDSDGLSKG
jgi:hypothetical protein